METGETAAVSARKPWYTSARVWISVVTFIIVGVLVIAAWPNIVEAFQSLSKVNVWVLLLLIPVQLMSYWTTGEVLFSYLRGRGDLRSMHGLFGMRLSLEFNFVNHLVPSGGAAGIAYATWKLNGLGVPASRSVLGQLVRFAVTFASFAILLAAATVWLLLSGRGTAGVLWAAGIVGGLAVLALVVGSYLLRRRRSLHRVAGFVARVANGVLRALRIKRRVPVIPLIRFADGLYLEMRETTRDPRALIKPFLWSFGVNIADSALFWVALAAFGIIADPALVFVAYGLATVASMIIATPNGTGGYEVALIGTLVAGGLNGPLVIAAVVLARVILLLGTILFGWGFYQHSVSSKPDAPKMFEHS